MPPFATAAVTETEILIRLGALLGHPSTPLALLWREVARHVVLQLGNLLHLFLGLGLGLNGLGGLEELQLVGCTVLGGSTRSRGSHVLNIQLSAKTYS